MTCLDRTLADRLLRIFKLSPWSRSLADRNLRIFTLLLEPLFGGPQLADFQTPFGAALWRTAFAVLGLIVLELLDPRERGALDPLRHNQFVRLSCISRFNGNRVRGMPLE